MDENDQTDQQDEADLLAKIGQHLFGQNLRVRVQLPTALATEAIAAWKRDDNMNRPGMSGDSSRWESWSHVREQINEVPRRAA